MLFRMLLATDSPFALACWRPRVIILPVLGTDRFKAQNYVPLLYDKVYYEKYLGCLIGENMIQWELQDLLQFL